MSARDRYHDWVKEILIQAGWVISHHPAMREYSDFATA
jgi:uncharacterized protein YbdZ (MbtH family)